MNRRPKQLPHLRVRDFTVGFGELLNMQLVAVLEDEEEATEDSKRKACEDRRRR